MTSDTQWSTTLRLISLLVAATVPAGLVALLVLLHQWPTRGSAASQYGLV